MGEAKKRREAQREFFLREAERWAFEPTAREAELVAEISSLPVLTVQKASPDNIAQMGMKRGACHENCRWYAANDPSGSTRAVMGWLVEKGKFTAHSVIEQDGRMFCITPFEIEGLPTIQFVPDDRFGWEDLGKHRRLVRDGEPIGIGVRADPAQTIRDCELVRDRLLSGMDPMRAIQAV